MPKTLPTRHLSLSPIYDN